MDTRKKRPRQSEKSKTLFGEEETGSIHDPFSDVEGEYDSDKNFEPPEEDSSGSEESIFNTRVRLRQNISQCLTGSEESSQESDDNSESDDGTENNLDESQEEGDDSNEYHVNSNQETSSIQDIRARSAERVPGDENTLNQEENKVNCYFILP